MSKLAALGAGSLQGFLGRLRYPQLFVLLVAVFIVDLLVPDMIPFADELLLGVMSTIVGLWRKRRDTEAEPEANEPSRPTNSSSGPHGDQPVT